MMYIVENANSPAIAPASKKSLYLAQLRIVLGAYFP